MTTKSVQLFRKIGVFWQVPDVELIVVQGPDARRFLQSQTTNDVNALAEGRGQSSCLLDRKAHVEANFDLFVNGDDYLILTDRSQSSAIADHLNRYIFADRVTVTTAPADWGWFTIQGPAANKMMLGLVGAERCGLLQSRDVYVYTPGTSAPGENHADFEFTAFRKTFTGEDGFLLQIGVNKFAAVRRDLEERCKSMGLVEMEPKTRLIARLEAGIAEFGTDYTNENLLVETGFEQSAVSYTKGCFLGQEVLARVRSHGAPSRALAGITFERGIKKEFNLDTPIQIGEETVGWLKSNAYSEQLASTIGLAMVKRDYRVPDKWLDVTISGEQYKLKVTVLPFIVSEDNAARARKLYEEALQVFAREDESVSTSAEPEPQSVKLLREALDLDPTFEDAYESLGVILSRTGNLTEAIELMRRLAELNPDSIMAHTNLSVFYMQQGDKEAAEEEKAISMSIRMRIAAREADIAKSKEKEKAEKQKEARERMEMFRQVLEIDSEDLLANYGFGSCLVELEQFAEAIPYLEKAIEVKPMHTVAYVDLSRAFEGLQKREQAIETLHRGIEVASKRGDMMPLKDMQARLAGLQ